MESYTSFDAESLHSFADSVNLTQNGKLLPPDHYDHDNDVVDLDPNEYENDSEHGERIIAHFPSPPSIKTLRRNYIVHELPLLQEINPNDGSEQFHPVRYGEGHALSYDLIVPGSNEDEDAPRFPLERLAERMFSHDHMRTILTTPRFLALFREFLLDERPRSLAQLTYYLNAVKALKALDYAQALTRGFPPFHSAPSSASSASASVSLSCPSDAQSGESTTEMNTSGMRMALERRVHDALDALTAEELPAFVTSTCIRITSTIVEERVRGTLPAKFQGTSDALAEVFCLTDPSRRDNPIIFASEEFHRTTQYGMDYVLGRNCRFLQGPHTNANSVRRIREAIEAGRHHSELFLNYRRDGSPFMNLLQCAPLCDSNGHVRYFIGAQIDVSGLALEGVQMDSFLALQQKQQDEEVLHQHEQDVDSMDECADDNMDNNTITIKNRKSTNTTAPNHSNKNNMKSRHNSSRETDSDEFHSFCELLSPHELAAVHHQGGHLYHPAASATLMRPLSSSAARRPVELDEDVEGAIRAKDITSKVSLTGAYENYLLVRPYPSLRILFTSPSLQIPGMLQSSFLSRIGSSNGVRDELVHALMRGRSVTARIKWLTRYNTEGRSRWVHCTPLMASNGEVGVWMVVIVDDDE